MKIKKFNENWADEQIEHDDMVKVSDILANAYNEIAVALNIEIDNNSEIFTDIEAFIVSKYKEMSDMNSEKDEDYPGYDMSAPSI